MNLASAIRTGIVLAWLSGLASGAGAPGAADAPAGAVRGTVYDADFGVPLGEARATLVGTRLRATSSPDGNFLIEEVPAGAYTLVVAKAGYERRVVSNVAVAAGQLTELGRVVLSPEVVEMDELVVTGTELLAGSEIALLELRAADLTMQDAISSELMSTAGASDVADALKLVVGASIVEGKYATVRGLSDRYTGTTLNGVRVPSADPEKRAVQVDLFPTGTLESVTVTKTFTPDLQGDFTGGGVDIKTKSIPDDFLLSFSLSAEHNSLATNNDEFLTYRGGGVDPTGFAGSERDLPAGADTADLFLQPLSEFGLRAWREYVTEDDLECLETGSCPDGGPPPRGEPLGVPNGVPDVLDSIDAARELDRFTRSFAPAMGTRRAPVGLNRGFSVVVGDRFEPGEQVVGLVGALTYSNKYDFYDDGTANTLTKDGAGLPLSFTEVGDTRDAEGAAEVLWGGLLNGVWRPHERHEFSGKILWNQSAKDRATFRDSEEGSIDILQNQALRYTERSVRSYQLHGSHTFPGVLGGPFSDLVVDWIGADNFTRQDEPDIRFFLNLSDRNTGNATKPDRVFGGGLSGADRNRRIFREIEEDNLQTSIDLTLPFTQWTASEGRLKLGVRRDETDRQFREDSFFYEFAGSLSRPSGVDRFSEADLALICNNSRANFENNACVGGENDGAPCQSDSDCAGGQCGDPTVLWTDVFTSDDFSGLAPDESFCSFYLDPRLAPFGGPFTEPTTGPYLNQLLWVLQPFDEDVDYTGDQGVDAEYAMVELPLHPRVKIVGGVRREKTEISIVPDGDLGQIQTIDIRIEDPTPQDPNSGDERRRRVVLTGENEDGIANIGETDSLPSWGVIWEVVRSMNVRAGWSRTVARPTFRELAPVVTEEFLIGNEFLGNPDLDLVKITNYDLRWEWFRRPGEVLAASYFVKNLRDPIELISFTQFGTVTTVTPVNFEKGEVIGWEVEARTSLDVLAKWLRHWSAGVNFSKIDSEVEVPEEERRGLRSFGLEEETRRLQGQPEFLLNANLTYDNERTGTSGGVFFNRIGETLLSGAAIGDAGTANVFEEAFSTLDVTFKRRVKQWGEVDFSVSFKAKNLLRDEERTVYRAPLVRTMDDDTVVVTEDEKTRTLHKTARKLSLSLGWKW